LARKAQKYPKLLNLLTRQTE